MVLGKAVASWGQIDGFDLEQGNDFCRVQCAGVLSLELVAFDLW